MIKLLVSTIFFSIISSAEHLPLQKGDILLQPLYCHLCYLIEKQTDSDYSHIGIVIETIPEIKVAEAFLSVREVSLREFMKKTEKNLRVKIMRPRFRVPRIAAIFRDEYLGLSYDHDFLWGNKDQKGEMIYCSELVHHLLQIYSDDIPTPVPMMYDKNYELWKKYFKAKPPVGKLGISPAAFDNEKMFDHVGYLSK